MLISHEMCAFFFHSRKGSAVTLIWTSQGTNLKWYKQGYKLLLFIAFWGIEEG